MSNQESEDRDQRLEDKSQKSNSRKETNNESQTKIRNPKSKECYCYIVECADGSFYTGWTTDLQRRVAAHNAGRGGRYTRIHRPVKLVYFERLSSRAEAMRREIAIKRMKRSAKLTRILNFKDQI